MEANSLETPRSTYRIQLTPSFGFREVENHLPYLADLGISHVYLSPIFEARPGSEHGYDVLDPTQLRQELGGEDGFERLSMGCRKQGMGLIVDFVPNHMSAHHLNSWWWDALKLGRKSDYWKFFDFQPKPKIVLPILGETLGEALRNKVFKIARTEAGLILKYHEHLFPLSPRSDSLFPKEFLPNMGDETTEFPNKLLEHQIYRLAYWKDSKRHATYRRFFNIQDLVGLRVEDEEVFQVIHSKLLDLYQRGSISGIRLDHIDGLQKPTAYLKKLSTHLKERRPNQTKQPFVVVEKILHREEPLPREWPVCGTTGYEFMDLMNTLLIDASGFEALTKAYKKLSRAKFDPTFLIHQSKKRVIYRLFQGELRMLLNRLKRLAKALAPDKSEELLPELEKALVGVTVALKPYRTYIEDDEVSDQDRRFLQEAFEDAQRLEPSVHRNVWLFLKEILLGEPSTKNAQEKNETVLDFIYRWQQFTGPVSAKGVEDTAFYNDHRLLSLNEVGGEPCLPSEATQRFHDENERRCRDWPMSLLATSTHDTKRSEDARARLHVLSANAPLWMKGFHRWRKQNKAKRKKVGRVFLPNGTLEWMIYQSIVATFPAQGDIDQSYVERIKGFVIKAMREGKSITSWMEMSSENEKAVSAFIDEILDPRSDFVEDIGSFSREVSKVGVTHSLTKLLSKMTAPGIPDFYQGTEQWSFTLVDPDNRRPLDQASLQKNMNILKKVDPSTPQLPTKLLEEWESGLLKQFVTLKGLQLRQSFAELFEKGRYIPLSILGRRKSDFVAFMRTFEDQKLLVGFPKLSQHLDDTAFPIGTTFWGDTRIQVPEGNAKWKDAFFNRSPINSKEAEEARGELWVAEWLKEFPLGLLVSSH